MDGFIDSLLLLRETDTTKEQLDENRIIKLGDVRDLVCNELKNDYDPPDIVINYIDLLMTAD